MKLDDLKSAWQEEISQSNPMEGLPMNAIINDVTTIHRAVRFRDFWMIFALAVGALLNVLFGWLTQEQVNWLSRLGVVVFIAATAIMTVALLRARSVTRSDDWTLRSRIEIEIERLEKQRRLLDRVGAWFLVPMLIAIALGSLGGYHARTGSYVPDVLGWTYYMGCGSLYWFTYWLVRREAKKKWEPLLARLRQVLADLSGASGAHVDTKF